MNIKRYIKIKNKQFNHMNEQNQFGIDTFRNVANTGPDTGKDLHPIVLRPITSDRYRVDIDDFGGVLSFGVPELDNTYKSTSIADKFRLSRVLEKDKENGEILIGKQEELQNLNTFVNDITIVGTHIDKNIVVIIVAYIFNIFSSTAL